MGGEFSLVLQECLLEWIAMADIKGLYTDKFGYYIFQPSSKGLPAGSRRPKAISLGTKNESEALGKLVEIRGMQAGQGGETKLREWVAVYLEERMRVGRHSARTNRQMTQSLGRALEWFGDVTPRSITRADVMAFYAAMQDGRTHGTVHQYLRYLRAVFFWLKERNAVVENPAAQLRLPVVRQTRRDRFCTPAERDALLAACNREDIRFVLMCGFYVGMRINEIVNARWRWFSAKTCTIQGEHKGVGTFETKTRKSRMVPLHAVFADYLSGLTRGDDDAFVLHPEKKQGKQWLRWDPRKGFKALTKACGVPWVTPHTMRHTFGSLHAMAGTPELKIRRWMGITQATLDRHYAGLSHEDPDVDGI